jgi:hypothetical protein
VKAECALSEECRRAEAGNHCIPGAVCGRPFLVAGAPRVAELGRGGDAWLVNVSVNVECLTPDERLLLAEHWTKLGLMDHASVAAFARFVLQLLELGAPADLIRSTQAALADEISHAELCFGIATELAGHSVQPAALSMTGALDAMSPDQVVSTAFAEACLGETIAAVEAELASEVAEDAAVKAALAKIAKDEARHAELGFRFLSWVLARFPARQREDLCRELQVTLQRELERASDDQTAPSQRLQGFGLLSAEQRMRARSEALREIVYPCAHALGIVDSAELAA